MTTARSAATTTTKCTTPIERRTEALAWATRQLRFERLMSSLERPVTGD